MIGKDLEGAALELLPRGRVPLDSHLFGGGVGDGRLRPPPTSLVLPASLLFSAETIARLPIFYP